MSAERRGSKRAPLEVEATIFVGSKRIPCRLLNVSTSGIGLVTSSPELPRASVRVQCLLPGEPEPISADAVLARHQQQGSEMQWGVMLLNPAPEVTARLGDFVGRVLDVEPAPEKTPSSEVQESEMDRAEEAERAKREELRKLRLQALMRKAVKDLDS